VEATCQSLERRLGDVGRSLTACDAICVATRVTAEHVVMNRQGLALAADSAVTIETGEGGRKAWQSANKIFGMSHRHPVAIMIYGGADLLTVPWDTTIKAYRDQLGMTSFPRLTDYTADFIRASTCLRSDLSGSYAENVRRRP